MKRIVIASLVSLSSLSSFCYGALASSQIMNQPLTAKPKFELSMGALFLQPSSSLLDYAVLGFPFPAESPHWKTSAVSPGYSTGFDLSARYYFDNAKSDVKLSWDHLQTSDSDVTQAGPSQFAVLVFQAGPSAGQNLNNPSTHASATAKFNYDVVNLDVGRYYNYNDNILFRVFLGLSTAQIKEKLSATFRDNAATYSVNMTNKSKFTGIGPLFGISGQYEAPFGIGLFGMTSLAGLIGTINPLTSFTSSSPQLASNGISSNYQSISPANTTQVVPAFDGKVGLNYSHAFYKETTFTVALGYEYAAYMNAIVAYTPSTVFGNVNTGTIALSSLQKSVSNFSLQGPFLNAALNFA